MKSAIIQKTLDRDLPVLIHSHLRASAYPMYIYIVEESIFKKKLWTSIKTLPQINKELGLFKSARTISYALDALKDAGLIIHKKVYRKKCLGSQFKLTSTAKLMEEEEQ